MNITFYIVDVFASYCAEHYLERISLGFRRPDGDPKGIVHRAALLSVGLFQCLKCRIPVAARIFSRKNLISRTLRRRSSVAS